MPANPARLIVVGAGIVGSGCAYAAGGLGAEVVLVDANLPGRATSAGAGIICPWANSAADAALFSFGCEAGRRYPGLVAALTDEGEEVGYRQVGALVLADDFERAEQLRQSLMARQANHPEMGEVQTAADARELFPPLRPTVAVRISGGARIDGRLISAALRRAAERSGATVLAGDARLHLRGDRVSGVVVDGQTIEGDAVVAATGAWTDEFLRPAGLTLGVVPQRGQIMHIGLPGSDTSNWPVILPERGGHYLLAFDDSRVVAGATRETGAGFDYRVTPAGLAEVLDHALSVAPGLAAGTYLETRIGFRPVGPDIRPVLGPAADGLVVATGLGAEGLTMGPFTGEIAARAALRESVPVDLAPFYPLRAA